MESKKTKKRKKEVDELEFSISVKVPTLREKIEKGMTDEEYAMACFEAHQKAGRKCFRELNCHKLCDLCPKNF
jgi:hypothetical protein